MHFTKCQNRVLGKRVSGKEFHEDRLQYITAVPIANAKLLDIFENNYPSTRLLANFPM